MTSTKHWMTVRRFGVAVVGSLGVALAVYASYAAFTWLRYGRARCGERDATAVPLDRFMPVCEVAERHETSVAAPAEITMAVAREVNIYRSPLVAAIFGVRTLPSRFLGNIEDVPSRSLLDETLSIGWGILAEEPDRYVVVGSVTQPWEPVVQFHPLPPDEYAAFHDPGFAKIVWTLTAEPVGPTESIFRTETRVSTTDPEARERFRRYWALVSPGVLLIRYEALRLVRAEAERRWIEARDTEGPR